MKKILIFSCFLMLLLCISASASKLSPAIDVIANENSIVKASVMQDGELLFDTSEFDSHLNTTVYQIKICSLPDADYGRLMLDNLYVVENQVIKREDFSMLRFVSSGKEIDTCCFSFEPNGYGYQIECMIKSLKSVNFSPVASNGEVVSAWTQRDISCYGTLQGYDPEGDGLKFEIVKYPEKGLVSLTDNINGDYVYTPFKKARGSDAFTYRVIDSHGNISEECRVNIKIEKLRTSLVYNDISDSKYQNAILVMSKYDILASENDKDGELIFNPKETITRESFLKALMEIMGAKNVPSVQKTRFADDLEIGSEYKGYVEAAYSLGIIKGTVESDGLHIYPKREITISEASVMINNILGAKAKGYLPTFKDANEIPSWASEDLGILCTLGILHTENGKINPNSPLTKEQTAQILMSLLEYRGKLKN